MSTSISRGPVIIDTCVWVEHVHHEVDAVRRLCDERRARVHPDVLGEVLLGCGAERALLATRLRYLDAVPRLGHAELESLIELHGIACKRIGWVDAGLLCTALVSPGQTTVLTFDKRLLREALRLGVAFSG